MFEDRENDMKPCLIFQGSAGKSSCMRPFSSSDLTASLKFFYPCALEARGEPEGEKIIKAAATSLQLLEVSSQSGLWVVDRPLGGIDTVWLSI